MNTIRISTKQYNSRRYSRPWIAIVTFSETGKATYNWGDWIGTVNGGTGSAGELIVTVDDGDIVAIGQKDNRGSSSPTEWYQVKEGKLSYLEGGKAEAFRLSQGRGGAE